MTEEQLTEDRITDREQALTVLVGAWGRWMRDSEPYYPDKNLWDFFERVLGPSGWPPERVLAAISEADRVVPEDGDPQKNWATIDRCFEAIGLGAPLRDREPSTRDW